MVKAPKEFVEKGKAAMDFHLAMYFLMDQSGYSKDDLHELVDQFDLKDWRRVVRQWKDREEA